MRCVITKRAVMLTGPAQPHQRKAIDIGLLISGWMALRVLPHQDAHDLPPGSTLYR
jgi:hypothetical protein